ncbi:MAG: GGDEF domain-containing protein [Woeseiaceae bacterium]
MSAESQPHTALSAPLKPLQREILEQLIAASAEPLVVARVDRPDWPVVLCNPAFAALSGDMPALERPLADVVEQLIGRELALEVSETVRSSQESSIPVEFRKREYLLSLTPLSVAGAGAARFYALYWRGVASGGPALADVEMQQALMRARRRVRDLSRDDPVTGLLTESAFREVLAHDWAVAEREQSCLALVCFALDDFDAYLEVFGRHAGDSCLRRVAQAVRRCLRRASDVAARITTDEGELLVVLSHSSEETGVQEFAARIAGAVRELGLHHPRSKTSRFVTVSIRTAVAEVLKDGMTADRFLKQVLGPVS